MFALAFLFPPFFTFASVDSTSFSFVTEAADADARPRRFFLSGSFDVDWPMPRFCGDFSRLSRASLAGATVAVPSTVFAVSSFDGNTIRRLSFAGADTSLAEELLPFLPPGLTAAVTSSSGAGSSFAVWSRPLFPLELGAD